MLNPMRLTWEVLRLATKAVMGVVQTVLYLVEREPLRRGERAARRGVLGPDDPPPPPELRAAALDYRGLVRPAELALQPWTYRLGRLREPGRRWGLGADEFGLAPQDIAQHACIIGPPRSGKTCSIVAPWIYAALGAGRSVLAVDSHGDLWPALRRYGEARGRLNARVYRWDHTDPRASSSWSWIDELDSDGALEAAAQAILGRPSEALAPYRRDVRLLTALLALAHGQAPRGGGRQPLSIVEIVDTIADRGRLRAFLARLPRAGPAHDLAGLLALSDDQYADAVGGILDGLRPLASAGIRRMTERPGFRLELLEREVSLLIARFPASAARAAESALGLLLALASERRLRGGGAPSIPMLLALDEASRIQSGIDLPTLLSLGPSGDLAAVLVAQSANQFPAAEREAILAACGTMIVLPGVDPPTTSYFTERLGQRPALGLSRSLQRTRFWDPPQRGLGASNEAVPMLGHREISTPPFEGRPAILHAVTIHPQPILLDLGREDL